MIPSLYPCFKHWSAEGTLWIYSDPHFNDSDVRSFDPNRPSDDELVKMINSKVGKKDTIIFLGDIGDISYIPKIRGYKVLIKGNHDEGNTKFIRQENQQDFATKEEAQQYLDKFPDESFPVKKISMMFCRKECDDYDWEEIEDNPWTTRWVGYADNCMFDEVYDGPVIISRKIILSHEPINLPFLYNFHGHIHNKCFKGTVSSKNCVAEVINYIPVNLTSLIKCGITSNIESLHRMTINTATINKKKREVANHEIANS